MTTPVRRRLAAMTLAASLAVSFLTPLAASDADAAPSGPGAAVTDRIATPALTWTPCDEGVDCATVTVPLDHDEPRGATIDLALTRHRATRPSHRVGSLFVNPGGPGGSAAEFAAGASRWASPTLLQRFDIIGMDPRGTNGSTGVHCFASAEAKQWTPVEPFVPRGSMPMMSKRCSSVGLAHRDAPAANSAAEPPGPPGLTNRLPTRCEGRVARCRVSARSIVAPRGSSWSSGTVTVAQSTPSSHGVQVSAGVAMRSVTAAPGPLGAASASLAASGVRKLTARLAARVMAAKRRRTGVVTAFSPCRAGRSARLVQPLGGVSDAASVARRRCPKVSRRRAGRRRGRAAAAAAAATAG